MSFQELLEEVLEHMIVKGVVFRCAHDPNFDCMRSRCQRRIGGGEKVTYQMHLKIIV